MAISPAHKFGQIIGEILENTMKKYFQEFATANNLYLDSIGKRKARSGKKVSWIDSFGNKHDLDFVLERNGTEDKIGTPVAFIESAWRRYTKHSRNKAQEIQGAVLPLASTHSHSAPFLGVILAGVFTKGALEQLKSSSFEVLYFEYSTVTKAFLEFGLDASFDEDTSTDDFNKKIKAWELFKDKEKVIDKLIEINKEKVETFFTALKKSVDRYITEVRILPLYGSQKVLNSIEEALQYLSTKNFPNKLDNDLVRFEVKIVYNNNDKIEASFSDCDNAMAFLSNYKSPKLKAK
ncbi:hypothetical protein [Flavobacterium suncheonense]|uniref:DNA methylase n=1 Tax=Flavobacterium suncheonense GH29-5 = DSM 17707 TaxID=1121899 RepID=A0A0A2MEH8_9FLAO|nr:hypothetical protein [Flavobacterium suncheonense]KGO86675.1 hypothetical protein Q764_13600 [Flavobacterium suncheonense GH29-5 = DSM 17707]